MALVAALMLVDEVDLQFTDLAAGPKVVLPDQPVEVYRRSGTSIGLVVRYLRNSRKAGAQFTQ